MHTLVPLSLVDPNPFRHMDRYPIEEDRIKDLMDSMDRTGFWDNVVARKVGSRYQLAYGHHRWIGFKRKFGDDSSINLIVKEISDPDMIRVMADENMTGRVYWAQLEQETVHAVVQAYAEGKIALERPRPAGQGGGHKLRLAPSFVPTHNFNDLKVVPDARPYNAESVARFLGWVTGGPDGDQVSPRVRNALSALQCVDEKIVEKKDMEGLLSTQAKQVVIVARDIKKRSDKLAESVKKDNPKYAEEIKKDGEIKARKAAKFTADSIRKGNETGVKPNEENLRRKALEKYGKLKHPNPPPSPDDIRRQVRESEKKAREFQTFIGGIFNSGDKTWDQAQELINAKDSFKPKIIEEIAHALQHLSERCIDIKNKLLGEDAVIVGDPRSSITNGEDFGSYLP